MAVSSVRQSLSDRSRFSSVGKPKGDVGVCVCSVRDLLSTLSAESQDETKRCVFYVIYVYNQ